MGEYDHTKDVELVHIGCGAAAYEHRQGKAYLAVSVRQYADAEPRILVQKTGEKTGAKLMLGRLKAAQVEELTPLLEKAASWIRREYPGEAQARLSVVDGGKEEK